MTPQPPVMLLDVDGVINAHGPYTDIYHKSKRRFNPHWDCRMSTGSAASGIDGRTYTMWWAQPVIDRLAALHTSGQVEIRWCTTWNSDGDTLSELFGLPQLEASFPTARLRHWEVARYKRQAANNVLEQEGRRLIWIDDNEVPYSWELSHGLMTVKGQALLIRPKEELGLLPAHFDQIEHYIGQPEPLLAAASENGD